MGIHPNECKWKVVLSNNQIFTEIARIIKQAKTCWREYLSHGKNTDHSPNEMDDYAKLLVVEYAKDGDIGGPCSF